MTAKGPSSSANPNVDADLIPPSIVWRDEVPESETFDDVYYSRDGGDAETRHVFLDGNGIPERWRGRERFVIAETGFGSGANFVATLRAWRSDPNRPRVLHFISVEGHPWGREDLERAHAWRPIEDQSWMDRLPARAPGVYRVALELGRVQLTLYYGEAATQLDRLALPPGTSVDAWFLDGFAPSRNPEMWSEPVFAAIGRASGSGSTFATYTSAGAVRRGLAACGFEVKKRSGYGRKREMAVGVFQSGDSVERATPRLPAAPWLRLREPEVPLGVRTRAIVLGAGLAGCAAARSLADAGLEVEVIDRHPAAAGGASGNPSAMIHPDLALECTPRERFFAGANALTLERIRTAGLEPDHAARCGALYPAGSVKAQERHLEMRERRRPLPEFARWLDADDATHRAGLRLEHDALFYPEAGWVQPAALCRVNLDHPNIILRLQTDVASIDRRESGWAVLDPDRATITDAPILVIASAADATSLAPLTGLPLRRIRGQVTSVPTTVASQRLRSVVYYGGYALPAVDGMHTVGATFDAKSLHASVQDEDDRLNLARLEDGFPALADALGSRSARLAVKGRAAFRTGTADHLPLVGPVPNSALFREEFAHLRYGRSIDPSAAAPWLDGLYLSIGHGSRGLITTQLAGEIIASAIVGDPAPTGRDVLEAISPARFWARAMIRRDDDAYPGLE